MEEAQTPLQRAIQLCGGQAALARKIGRSQQNVAYWLTEAVRGVPAEVVPAIEQATDFQVTRHQLRPDVFGERAA